MEMRVLETLSFTQSLSKAVDNISSFKGRSRRSEFWWPMLVVAIVSLFFHVIGLIMYILTIPLTFRRLHDAGKSGWWWGVGAIVKVGFYVFCFMQVLLPSFALADPMSVFDFSWFNYNSLFISSVYVKMFLFMILCLAYDVVLVILLCQDSQPYDNKYGASTKYALY